LPFIAQTLALVPELNRREMLPRREYKTNRQNEAATKQHYQTGERARVTFATDTSV
jgi:hypothetical protein